MIEKNSRTYFYKFLHIFFIFPQNSPTFTLTIPLQLRPQFSPHPPTVPHNSLQFYTNFSKSLIPPKFTTIFSKFSHEFHHPSIIFNYFSRFPIILLLFFTNSPYIPPLPLQLPTIFTNFPTNSPILHNSPLFLHVSPYPTIPDLFLQKYLQIP